MSVIVDNAKCTACSSCVEACPVEAIKVNDHAVINDGECLECGACIGECPTGAIVMPE